MDKTLGFIQEATPIKKNLVLRADPDFTYSMNTQIKEQLKWLIGIDAIQPGELLPPAGQLADKLKVNRNTVNLVYTQLRDEGIFSIKKGRDTQVVEGPAVEALRNKRKPMYELLARIMEEAKAGGMNLTELATAGFAFVQLFEDEPMINKRILLIECREHDHPFYQRQVERITKAEVSTCFIEDIAKDPGKLDEAAGQAEAVVTTLNHADEVKRLFSGKSVPILTIGAAADMSILLQIAQMEPGSKVAFVCLGKQGGRWMADRVRDAGIGHIEDVAAGIDNKEALQHALQTAKRVYASSAVYEDIVGLAPDKIVPFPMVLEKSSEMLLQELVSE